MTRTIRLWAALLAVATIGGTACSVSSTDDKKASGSTTTAATKDSASVEPGRGVTADSIKLGVAVIDTEQVKSKFGVDLGKVPEGVIGALVKEVNDKGGINGRKIDAVERPFLPVGTEDSEKACRELIEDNKVFAVAGMFLGDGGLCVTETYSTPYIASFGLSKERQERSKAPFLSVEGSAEDVLSGAVKLFVSEGVLKGKKVAVYHESAENTALVEGSIIEPLKEAKVDVVSVAQLPSSGDPVQAATDIDRVFQKFQADGADTILSASGASVFLPALERTDWKPQLLFTNGQFTSGDSLDGYGLTKPDELKGAQAATLSVPSEKLVGDKRLKSCLDTINKGIGTNFTTNDIFPKEAKPESQEIGQLVMVCQLWDFTVQVLTAAGKNLNNETLLSGLDSMKDFSLAGRPDLSLSTTKWGADANMHMWHWDTKVNRFVRNDS